MTGPAVKDRIRQARTGLAPAEQRVVEALLDDYPMSGLGSVAQLASSAGVSAPTVMRLMTKLGFEGYVDFRAQLRAEITQHGFSPLDAYPEERGLVPAEPAPGPPGQPGLPAEIERAYLGGVQRTFRGLDPGEFAAAVAALADLDREVVLVGGRFSWPVAAMFASYLQILRPGVEHVPPEPGVRARRLLSVSASSTFVVFDFRRYQPDTIEFAALARARGGLVVLVTDPYLSPLVEHADVVLTTAVAGAPPFDAMSYAVMVTEALVGAVARALGPSARARLADFESLPAGGIEPLGGVTRP